MEGQKRDNNLVWGVLLMGAGILLLLSNLNFWPDFIHHYIIRWESLLMAMGLLLVIVRRKIVGGMALFGVGAYFFLEDLYPLGKDWDIWFWPILFLMVGVGLIFTRKCDKYR